MDMDGTLVEETRVNIVRRALQWNPQGQGKTGDHRTPGEVESSKR